MHSVRAPLPGLPAVFLKLVTIHHLETCSAAAVVARSVAGEPLLSSPHTRIMDGWRVPQCARTHPPRHNARHAQAQAQAQADRHGNEVGGGNNRSHKCWVPPEGD